MTAPRPFLFGKLPRQGDFLSRGLDCAARDEWDGWLSAHLRSAREEFGEGFEAAHEAAAAWRFVRGRGDLEAGWEAGALAPSIDAAGRRFFIVVGGAGLTGMALRRAEAIAQAMEESIYRAFEEGWDGDDLAGAARDALAGAVAGDDPTIPDEPREHWWTAGGADGEVVRLDHAPLQLIRPTPILEPTEASA